jgi:D-glycero-D-manno-heptose 1,7-bisphosphate phosphatase
MGERKSAILMLRPAIFFDRDGILTVPIALNGKGYAPRSLEDFTYYEDAIESLLRTRAAGFLNIVVSNQPDISTGLLLEDVLERMNSKMLQDFELDEVNNCPHNSDDNCQCRKPKPGMIQSSTERQGIDLSKSWMVGDRDGDITAGSIAGLRTVFVDRSWLAESGNLAEFKCLSLTEAVDIILRNGTFEDG